ncbi:helix-turn-helix domain-containing protein [Ralstonia insidiosa]|uniref:helix-turn-helix domain-containing protein n=1 Tax=Ralstonia insidiosa TaxID=190721 RepID=UPI000CEE562E|nr:helix-turn-helix transcriptional regulator [Ralstonia insidiosa]
MTEHLTSTEKQPVSTQASSIKSSCGGSNGSTGAAAFGVVLMRLRRQRSMTQQRLAAEADLDRTYISYLENGHRSPTLDTMLAISRALCISLAQLASLIEGHLSAKAGEPPTR